MELIDRLNALIAEGLEFNQAIEAFAKGNDEIDTAFIDAAQRLGGHGAVEIDTPGITSRGDDVDGAFVLAWLWVDRDATNLPPLEEA